MHTWSTSMPRSARSSSTSRWDRPNRRYQRTASVITSGGNRYPAKAELGAGLGRGRRRRRRRDLMVGVSLMRVLGARCNSAVPTSSEENDVDGEEVVATGPAALCPVRQGGRAVI